MPLSEILLQLFPTLPYKWHGALGLIVITIDLKLQVKRCDGEDVIQVDNYKISLTAELGRGTTGTVYKAEDIESGLVAAAKKISLENKPNVVPEDIRKLYDLLWIHKHIVAVSKVNWNNFNIWIFMEYCENNNLGEYFKSSFAVLNWEKCRSMMKQIITGLDFLHRLNIIHMDLKPQNILVSQTDATNSISLKLADFGLKRHFGVNCTDWEKETLLFHSPFVWKHFLNGENPLDSYDKYDDIFSAGLLFLAITEAKKGKALVPVHNPVMSQHIGLEMHKQQTEGREPVRVAEIADGDDEVTVGIKGLIQSMTSYNPDYQIEAERVLELLTYDDKLIQWGKVGANMGLIYLNLNLEYKIELNWTFSRLEGHMKIRFELSGVVKSQEKATSEISPLCNVYRNLRKSTLYSTDCLSV